MTGFHDLSRPRLGNGNPSWLTAQIALPHVHLKPLKEPDMWRVELVLDGSWIEVELPLRGVMSLLNEWRADPEEALMNYWGQEPPTKRVQLETEEARAPENITTTVMSPEDLGL